MARSVQWRRTRPEAVVARTEEALQKTLYILHQSGPTGFVLKEEGRERKFKVSLGAVHQCSCSVNKREKELCVHILWLLLKRFRVPRENPATFQLGLVEREIDELLHGYLRQQSPKCDRQTNKSNQSNPTVTRRDITPDDVCPICQETFFARRQPITYCQFGCGQNIHVKCMKMWAEHQRSRAAEESCVHCPLCREEFGTFKDICQQMYKPGCRQLYTEKSSTHLGVACSYCRVCPIVGMCYRCTTCAGYHLCHDCFSSDRVHVSHSFECRKHPTHPWRTATRSHSSLPSLPSTGTHNPTPPPLLPSIVNNLQNRSLTESDYELLLNLDSTTTGANSHNRQHQRLLERVINSFHVEPVAGDSVLLREQASCEVCGCLYHRGDWLRKLPCHHKFHRACIDQWLTSGHTVCPIDGRTVCDLSTEQGSRARTLSQRSKGREGETTQKRKKRMVAKGTTNGSTARTEALELTLSVQSIGHPIPTRDCLTGPHEVTSSSRAAELRAEQSVKVFHRRRRDSTPVSRPLPHISPSGASTQALRPERKSIRRRKPLLTEAPSNASSHTSLPGVREVPQVTRGLLESPGSRDSLTALTPTCSGYHVTPPPLTSSPLTSPQDPTPQCLMTTALRNREVQRSSAKGAAVERVLWRTQPTETTGHHLRHGAQHRGCCWGGVREGRSKAQGTRTQSKLIVSSLKLCPISATPSLVSAHST